MNTGKYRIGLVEEKVDCKDFNEAFRIVAVKNEPREIDIFTSVRYTDFVDHKHSIDVDYLQDHNEDKLDAKNRIPKDLRQNIFVEDLSSTCSTLRMKSDTDIPYEDIKRETGDEKLMKLIGFCDVCHQSFDEETELIKSTSFRSECSCQKPNQSECYIDMKPSSLELATDSGSKLPVLQDDALHGDELAKERDNKGKRKFSSEPAPVKKIHCKRCSKSFNRMDNLKVHERIHTGEKPFSCGICLRAFTNSSQLTVHGRVHTGEKPFHCELCSKSFSQMITLKIHVRSHTGEKPYHCKICSDAFTNLSGLRVHGKRVHTVKNLFQCKTCLESFSQLHTLKVHERGHTGEKVFQCEICSKAFINSRGLRAHRKIHAGEKPFHCIICSKSFRRKASLKNHERGHSGEKPFCCKVCFKRFSYSSGLRAHGKIHTGEN